MRNFTNKEAADPAAKNLSETAPPPAADAPKTTCIFTDPFFAYGCSLQGESHKGTNTPCQDFQDAITAENSGTLYLISGIADGVSSCELSHYGAAAAVQQALKTCADGIAAFAAPPTDEECRALLKAAFTAAQDAVEARADEMDHLTFDFCSTLTVCIYNGKKLHLGHIGDDGVVALFSDRTMKLVTIRHKGEAANELVPLQFGKPYWQFLTVDQVDGFVMATDGILDFFVKTPLYDNMVFLPFASNLLFQTVKDQNDADGLLADTLTMLQNKECRTAISDDLTLLVAGSRSALAGKEPPAFDAAAWAARIEAVDRRVNEALARAGKEPPQAAGASALPAESEPPQAAKSGQLPAGAEHPHTASHDIASGEPLPAQSAAPDAPPKEPRTSDSSVPAPAAPGCSRLERSFSASKSVPRHSCLLLACITGLAATCPSKRMQGKSTDRPKKVYRKKKGN